MKASDQCLYTVRRGSDSGRALNFTLDPLKIVIDSKALALAPERCFAQCLPNRLSNRATLKKPLDLVASGSYNVITGWSSTI